MCSYLIPQSHTHTHSHIRAHTHTDSDSNAHVHTHTPTRTHTCRRTQTRTSTHTNANTCMHPHSHTHKHTHTRTHSHTCTHTHTQTQAESAGLRGGDAFSPAGTRVCWELTGVQRDDIIPWALVIGRPGFRSSASSLRVTTVLTSSPCRRRYRLRSLNPIKAKTHIEFKARGRHTSREENVCVCLCVCVGV